MESLRFVPGQRWVSNTESDLGLGIVIAANHRQVTINFPAAAEERCYAAHNAPLSRIAYNPTDQVSSHQGLLLTINERVEQNGRFFYQGTTVDGEQQVLDEMELDSFVHFNKPQDRLFAGQIDKLSTFDLRADTLEHVYSHRCNPAYGLIGPRVQLLPHQLYIARHVAQRYSPRVLLADEVGLGKTIEAGLIIHQQWCSGRIARVLIVVPDSLVHQWLIEMLRRFNLSFSILDRERCQALTESGESNPFETAQLVLCPLSELVDDSRMNLWVQQAGWDMLVVDEAHHLQWSPQQSSPEYNFIEQLSKAVPSLLLLTATPEQLGLQSHFARLRLLDPDRYFDFDHFVREEAGYQAVNDLVHSLLELQEQLELQAEAEHGDSLEGFWRSGTVPNAVERYLGDSRVQQITEQWQQPEQRSEVLNDVIDALLDRHGTGRVLFRNTRQGVSGFPQRQLVSHELEAPDFYWQEVELDPGGLEADTLPLSALLQPERLWPVGDNDWLQLDPRVAWLSDWLLQQRREEPAARVLVICASAMTAITLEQHLRLRLGIKTAVFHEGLSLVARDRAAAYFADSEDGAQVLICSEIGSEGRNFQFAHQLVLFDLPFNPDLLEQRIGRLDRIGQTRDVVIHVPYYRDSAQSLLLHWLHEGIDAFLTSSPAGSVLFEQQREALEQHLRQAHLQQEQDDDAWQQLLTESQAQYRQLSERMEQGRHRLLELNSCRQPEANNLIDHIIKTDISREISSYIERLLDELGVDQQTHSRHQQGALKGSAQSLVLQPGERMYHASLPGLPEDGLTATFSRALALHREDMALLTLEHPLVVSAIETVTSGELGNTAVATLKLPPIKPGSLLLEALFIPHCPAPAVIRNRLNLQQYLSQPSVRVLINAEGADLSAALSRSQLSSLVKRVPLGQAQEVVKHAREDIATLVKQAESIASHQEAQYIADAVKRMQHHHEQELKRLQDLAQVNANIRESEITAMRDSGEELHRYLGATQLNLDALRLIIAT